MFYIKNRITNDSYFRSKYLSIGTLKTKLKTIMYRLNINCYSCQTAGNSNVTLFQMAYFVNACSAQGFHLNA
jgi:hypothetical protein